jgi:hypothetical protein
MNACTISSDSNNIAHATVRAPGAGVADTPGNSVDSVPADNQRLTGVWNGPTGIRHVYPYTLFNKSPLQLRRIGGLGGKAHGRNQRARRALMPTPPAATPLRSASRQSTAEAVAALDVQFPWLCGAEKRPSRKLPPSRLKCTFRTPRKG